MDPASIAAFVQLGEVAVAAGIQTLESFRGLLASNGVGDDAALDQIVSEGTARAAARDAEAAKPDPAAAGPGDPPQV